MGWAFLFPSVAQANGACTSICGDKNDSSVQWGSAGTLSSRCYKAQPVALASCSKPGCLGWMARQ